MKALVYTLFFLSGCIGNLYAQTDSTTAKHFPKGLHKRIWNEKYWSYRTLGPVIGLHGFGTFGYEAGIGLARVRGSYNGAWGHNINLVWEHFPQANIAGPKLNYWTGIAILILGLGVGVNTGYYTNYQTDKAGICVRPEIGLWFRGLSFKYGVNINQVKDIGLPRKMFTMNMYWALWAPKKPLASL